VLNVAVDKKLNPNEWRGERSHQLRVSLSLCLHRSAIDAICSEPDLVNEEKSIVENVGMTR